MALRSEFAIAPPGDFGRVVSLGVSLGSVVTNPSIGISTSASVVVAEANSIDAEKLTVGLSVTLTGSALPTAASGTILSIGEVRKNDAGGLSATVTIIPDSPLPTELGETDRLQVDADLSIDEVPGLLIPITAIYSNADGSTAVIVYQNNSLIRINVTVLAVGNGVAKVSTDSNALAVGSDVYIGIQ